MKVEVRLDRHYQYGFEMEVAFHNLLVRAEAVHVENVALLSFGILFSFQVRVQKIALEIFFEFASKTVQDL